MRLDAYHSIYHTVEKMDSISVNARRESRNTCWTKTSVFSIVCFYEKFCKKLGKVLGQVVFSDVFCVMASLVIKAKDLLIGILQFQTSHIRRWEG